MAALIPAGSPYKLPGWVRDQFADEPSLETQIFDDYIAATEETPIWAQPPVMLEGSVAYMRRHFDQFDPRRTHSYMGSPIKLWVPDAVSAAPLFDGVRVEVIGRINALNLLHEPFLEPGEPLGDARVEVILQLAPITFRQPFVVYCRLPRKIKNPLRAGQHVAATGIIIAAGAIRSQAGGTLQASYMACQAVKQPPGWIGEFTRDAERRGINVPDFLERARKMREKK